MLGQGGADHRGRAAVPKSNLKCLQSLLLPGEQRSLTLLGDSSQGPPRALRASQVLSFVMFCLRSKLGAGSGLLGLGPSHWAAPPDPVPLGMGLPDMPETAVLETNSIESLSIGLSSNNERSASC